MTCWHRTTWMAALAALALGGPGCGQEEELKCPAGLTPCGGVCVDVTSDPDNCVICGRRCPIGATCTTSGCQCPAGQGDCGGGACVSLSLDPNCGVCGHACGALGSCGGAPPACTCAPPATSCGPAASPECVDVNADDPVNCGACGVMCGHGSCGGTPQLCTCDTGWTRCDASNPRCVDLLADEENCGGCGVACAAGQVCSLGTCCPAGWTNCYDVCRDLLGDEANCGACGLACAAGQTCSLGTCCPTGQTSCSGTCRDLLGDEANCGACNHACSASQTCLGGTCTCVAPAPLACGTTCCAGTACCGGGTSCQLAHSNGLGQSYYSCAPLGSPGSGGTYTATMAVQAGEAWAPGASANPAFPCGGGYCNAVVANGQCAVWCYQSLLAGYVNLNAIGITCLCPTNLSREWN